MKHAIADLEVSLAAAVNNEPIHRQEGRTEQADLCAEKIKELNELIPWLKCFGDPMRPKEPQTLKERIRHAINCVSAENGSDTPDFILADYLLASLDAFDAAVVTREKWYGREAQPVETPIP